MFSDPHAVTIDRELLIVAHTTASSIVVEAMLKVIDVKNKKDEYIDIIPKMEMCWDDDIAQALVAKLQDPSLSVENRGDDT